MQTLFRFSSLMWFVLLFSFVPVASQSNSGTLETCISYVKLADRNSDGYIDIDEFVGFIHAFVCAREDGLNSEAFDMLTFKFKRLACPCLLQFPALPSCCGEEMARVNVRAAGKPPDELSVVESEGLSLICSQAIDIFDTVQCRAMNHPPPEITSSPTMRPVAATRSAAIFSLSTWFRALFKSEDSTEEQQVPGPSPRLTESSFTRAPFPLPPSVKSFTAAPIDPELPVGESDEAAQQSILQPVPLPPAAPKTENSPTIPAATTRAPFPLPPSIISLTAAPSASVLSVDTDSPNSDLSANVNDQAAPETLAPSIAIDVNTRAPFPLPPSVKSFTGAPISDTPTGAPVSISSVGANNEGEPTRSPSSSPTFAPTPSTTRAPFPKPPSVKSFTGEPIATESPTMVPAAFIPSVPDVKVNEVTEQPSAAGPIMTGAPTKLTLLPTETPTVTPSTIELAPEPTASPSLPPSSTPTAGPSLQNTELKECVAALVIADGDNSASLTLAEYLRFTQVYSQCPLHSELTTVQIKAFNALAVFGEISISGVSTAGILRTNAEQTALSQICATSSLIPVDCVSPTTAPIPALGLSSCVSYLVSSDRDSDSLLNRDEYLRFIISRSQCNLITQLSEDQTQTFIDLACKCLEMENANPNCCLLRNARVDIEGANQPSEKRSAAQQNALAEVCSLTKQVTPEVCGPPPTPPPSIPSPSSRLTRAPTVTIPAPTDTESPSDSRGSPTTISGSNVPAESSGQPVVTPPSAVPTPSPSSRSRPTRPPTVFLSSICISAILESDSDPRGGFLSEDEFLLFVQAYSGCDLLTHLTLEQKTLFGIFAGACLEEENPDYTCILPGNSRINVAGVELSDDARTSEQTNFLAEICSKIERTFEDECVATPTTAPLITDGMDQCLIDLLAADDGDGLLDLDEYLLFIQKYGQCPLVTELDMGHKATFLSLACECTRLPGNTIDCCLPSKARLDVRGAGLTAGDRTSEQSEAISRICITANGLTDRECKEAPTLPPRADDCSEALVLSDANSDGFINLDEFLSFMQQGYDDCAGIESLSLTHRVVHNVLACDCLFEPGAQVDCCFPLNAKVNISGASLRDEDRTTTQRKALSSICRVSNATVDVGCQKFPTFAPTPTSPEDSSFDSSPPKQPVSSRSSPQSYLAHALFVTLGAACIIAFLGD